MSRQRRQVRAVFPTVRIHRLLVESRGSDWRSWLLVAAGLACSCAREPCHKLARGGEASRESELALFDSDFEFTPRCRANAPGCGPVPLRGEGAYCYRPAAARERLPARTDDEAGPFSRSGYACAHDGECNLNGCGNACTSYRMGHFDSNCIGYDWLDKAQFCGCVEGECAFFRQ
jgi:hypothetical protein